MFNKKNPDRKSKKLSDSEATSTSTFKGKRRVKGRTSRNQYGFITGINQKQLENYTLTVLRYKNDRKQQKFRR